MPGYQAYAPPPRQPFLPTKLKDSMRFFQVPARAWWWGLIALAVYAVCFFVSQLVAGIVMVDIMPASAGDDVYADATPSIFLVNNIAIIVEIPICILISWLFFRQGFGWLVSVVGRFRWRWFGTVLGIFAIGYVMETIAEILLYGPEDYGLNDIQIQPYTAFMIIAIVLTTPFQCAGEEFQSRSLLPRLITAIVPFRWVGLALSAVITSGLFMYMHSAADPWLNLNYFCVGMMMWWLAYRTGGIEASIAYHIVNNMFAEWMLPFTDMSGLFDRSEGTGSWIILVFLAVELVLVLIVDMVARNRGIVRMSAPAAETPEVVKPREWYTALAGSSVPATPKDLPRMSATTLEIPPAAWAPQGYPAQFYPPPGYPYVPAAPMYPPPYGPPEPVESPPYGPPVSVVYPPSGPPGPVGSPPYGQPEPPGHPPYGPPGPSGTVP